ncbi:MAG: activator of HSP90 ATPase [Hyphomicrobiaceae bacterium]|jgi:activator of HSP90 ATPase
MPKTLQLTVTLPGSPDELFDAYTDQKLHGAWVGSPMFVATSPGGEFRAFNDQVSGRILHTAPKRMIVQTWRSMGWKPGDGDSVLIITLTAVGSETQLDLVQVGIPDDDFDNVEKGWESYYWKPWRERRAAA